jgi:hypothetical protein
MMRWRRIGSAALQGNVSSHFNLNGFWFEFYSIEQRNFIPLSAAEPILRSHGSLIKITNGESEFGPQDGTFREIKYGCSLALVAGSEIPQTKNHPKLSVSA